MKATTIAILFVGVWVSSARAQTPPPSGPPSSSQEPVPAPPAPAPQARPVPAWHPSSSDSYRAREGILCGGGASQSPAGIKPTVGCGAGSILPPLPIFIEIGMMGPQANRSAFSGYLSLDGDIPLAKDSSKYLPMAMIGYSRLFETGHALDYGLALGMPRFGKPKDPSSSLRIELRDYWTFANPTQHNIMLRIGWMGPIAD